MKTIEKSKLIFKSYLKEYGTKHTFVIFDENNWNCYFDGKLITKTRDNKYNWIK